MLGDRRGCDARVRGEFDGEEACGGGADAERAEGLGDLMLGSANGSEVFEGEID